MNHDVQGVGGESATVGGYEEYKQREQSRNQKFFPRGNGPALRPKPRAINLDHALQRVGPHDH